MFKILITGGAGFIGSNFILRSFEKVGLKDCKILNIDKLTYSGNLQNLIKIKDNPNYNFIQGDIFDYNLIRETLIDFSPNILVNFAKFSVFSPKRKIHGYGRYGRIGNVPLPNIKKCNGFNL